MAKISRAFRPMAERVEERAMTTGGVSAALSHHFAQAGTVESLAVRSFRRPLSPIPGTLPIGPGLGEGLVRLALPLNYVKFGVVSLWNNTTNTVTFGLSASTYANGQYFQFTLNPGQVRSFYAPFANTAPPVFRVAINPNFRPVVLPQMNIIFDDPSYFPAGTAGRPYAINLGVNGLKLSYI